MAGFDAGRGDPYVRVDCPRVRCGSVRTCITNIHSHAAYMFKTKLEVNLIGMDIYFREK